MAITNLGVATTTDLDAGANEYKATIGDRCPAGRYGQVVGSIKICFMCAPGTVGAQDGCTPCAAGTSSSIVGQTAAGNCASCPAGTYAQAGEAKSHGSVVPRTHCSANVCTRSTPSAHCQPAGLSHTLSCCFLAAGSSDCLPCPAGTYSGSTAAQCTHW